MKVRNKKTGETVILIDHIFDNYNSLAELNDEWEDYEEPKEDYIRVIESFILYVEEADDSFYCDESVKKFVEKLKAWKRLKDNGFRFDGWDENHHNLGIIEFSFDKVENNVWDFDKDLDLLFGGDE